SCFFLCPQSLPLSKCIAFLVTAWAAYYCFCFYCCCFSLVRKFSVHVLSSHLLLLLFLLRPILFFLLSFTKPLSCPLFCAIYVSFVFLGEFLLFRYFLASTVECKKKKMEILRRFQYYSILGTSIFLSVFAYVCVRIYN
ncbi:hypothetical protein M5D96_003240, partial [Drosophila gunungcola]